MSIVVYRDGVMASDSGAWNGDFLISRKTQKVFKVRDHLIGIVGTYVTGLAFVKEFEKTGKFDLSKATGDNYLIVVTPRRSIFFYVDGGAERFKEPFAAGGGPARGVALGALHMGACARAAVRIAIRVGPWAVGKIQEVRL